MKTPDQENEDLKTQKGITQQNTKTRNVRLS